LGKQGEQLDRRIAANKMLEKVVELCIECARVGTHFSFENPWGSFLFKALAIDKLKKFVCFFFFVLFCLVLSCLAL